MLCEMTVCIRLPFILLSVNSVYVCVNPGARASGEGRGRRSFPCASPRRHSISHDYSHRHNVRTFQQSPYTLSYSTYAGAC